MNRWPAVRDRVFRSMPQSLEQRELLDRDPLGWA